MRNVNDNKIKMHGYKTSQKKKKKKYIVQKIKMNLKCDSQQSVHLSI